eukprot:Em0017g876a
MTRSMLSAGAEDADILFEDELRLAIKSMLGIPWILNRWLKQAGVDSTFGGMKRTVKMHLLKDHMVKCMDVNTPSRLWLNGRAGS